MQVKIKDPSGLEHKNYISYSSLVQNTEYYIKIETVVSSNFGGLCSTAPVYYISGITGKHTGPPPPPGPVQPDKTPQLYITSYGQSSFKVLAKSSAWNNLPFYNATGSGPADLRFKEQIWGMVRQWSIHQSNLYLNLIYNHPEIKFVIWSFADYATIMPPDQQNPPAFTGAPPNNVLPSKWYLRASGQYGAINGPIDFGLSYNCTTKSPNVKGKQDASANWWPN